MKVTVTGLPLRWSPPLTEGSQGSFCPKGSPTSAVRSPDALLGSQEPGSGWPSDLPPRCPPPPQGPDRLWALNATPQPASTMPTACTRRRRNKRRGRRDLSQRSLTKEEEEASGADGGR